MLPPYKDVKYVNTVLVNGDTEDIEVSNCSTRLN
jgi:hypothetical protein